MGRIDPARVRRIAVGQASYLNLDGHPASRYFTVTAGIGVDAHLFYRLNAGMKKRLGMLSYYGKATQLWLTDPLLRFVVQYQHAGGEEQREALVSELPEEKKAPAGGGGHGGGMEGMY